MFRATLLSLLVALVCQPAFADQWLAFPPGATVTSQVWQGQTAPTVGDGGNLPAGTTVVEWTPQNNDSNPNNYTLQQDGTLAYTPPPPPVAVPQPDPVAAKNLIFSDPNITGAAMLGLLQNSGISLINDYPSNPDGSRAVWSFLKQQFSSSWLTSSVITAVESDCAQANISIGTKSQIKTSRPPAQDSN